MFATGIENSNPTIGHGKVRVDQLESCGFYKHWKTDFDIVEDLGVGFLRYGPPIHRVWLGPDSYDWAFTDLTMNDLKRRAVVPIVDLCHFGLPDWIGDFQKPDFPRLFEAYATAFAARFPWVRLYTPINEIFICATFSARYGWWNEQLRSDRAFVTALKLMCRANVLAMDAILKVRADAVFIQSESCEYFHPEAAAASTQADQLNAIRFLSLDLSYGRPVEPRMRDYLLDNGMTGDEQDWFLGRDLTAHCVLGGDYYLTNEHRVAADGSTRSAGEILGYGAITRQYYRRYGLPVMHSETNLDEGPRGDEAAAWLRKQWSEVMSTRTGGVPIVGFTWYSLTDQVDWDVALREKNGRTNPRGLYDLDRNIRAVGRCYRQIIRDWTDPLPQAPALPGR
jgi:beta-glucosidase/6-phospho-beta-glucosidase/beta-galactosidase